MEFDLNTAAPQWSDELIPAGTIAPMRLTLRPGGFGDGGWLRQSDSGALMLDCEFTILDGPHARRKFWTLMIVGGPTEGHEKAANITKSTLRAIMESALGVEPDDQSPAAIEQRRSNPPTLNGITFVGKVGIEKGRDGYNDRNKLAEAVLPNSKNYQPVSQDGGWRRYARTLDASPAAPGGKAGSTAQPRLQAVPGGAARPTNW